MSKSDQQTDPRQFRTAREIRDDEPEPEAKPDWNPQQDDDTDTGSLARCDQCDELVSGDFQRVFSNNDGVLENGCQNCSTFREYTGQTGFGSGAGVEFL